MAYLFGIAVLILLFIVLHFFTEIALKQKLTTILIFSAFILGAYLFNLNSENRRLHLNEISFDFEHGKTIKCDGLDVNNSEFSYSSGTQTFLGLKESKMYGRILSLDSCQ
ncbi:MAG: hypothetical protein COA44_05140 [Arcobacter sp.]|nr:MAG: hypothetical protein COA44_05140 [Arcobacter sp.]